MEIKSCKCCNRAFGYNGGPVILCSKCDELLWGKVKEYLKEHPNSSAEEVSKETKVKIDIINDFLADDRLKSDDIDNNINQFDKCQGCGAIIDKGNRYCSSCLEKEKKKKILNEISNIYIEEQRQDIKVSTNNSSRMYTESSRLGRRR